MFKFDFNEWAQLSKDDPVEFERRRKEVLDAEILKAPIKNRGSLRLLQMECDAYRNSMDPLEASACMLFLSQLKLNLLDSSLKKLLYDIDQLKNLK